MSAKKNGGPMEALAQALCQEWVPWTPDGPFDAPHMARHRLKADLVIEHLRALGFRIVRDDTWRWLQSVAANAVEPRGEHRLIDGYCPDCGGSCLLGFGNNA